jgi:carbamate kinase
VEAACRFVEGSGESATIASPDRIADAVAGTAGTVVTADER